MEVEDNQKIRILVVDDDTTCLLNIAASLKNSKFEVMTVKSAKDALDVLRSSGHSFDFVLTDVHMPEMDGFQLQQEIIKEFDIPVGFLSDDEKECTATKAHDNGAVFFIMKPITQYNIHDLWEYVTSRKKKRTSKQVVQEFQKNTNEKIPNEVIHILESSSSVNERSKTTRKYEEGENEDGSSLLSKKSKIVWTDSLHNEFLKAVTKLGLEKANPSKVLEIMNIRELNRKHISSHLQKYRDSLKKKASPKLILNTEVDHQDSEYDNKDKKLAKILTRHLNQKPCNVQRNYGGITIEEILFQHHYVPPNSELEQENQEGVITEEGLLQLLNDPPNTILEQNNYGGIITTEETSLQHHYVLPNLEPEQEDHVRFTAEECSFLQNIVLNHELEKENQGGVAAKEGSFQLHNDPSNSKLEQKNYGDITTEETSFQHHYVLPNLEPEQENHGFTIEEERPFHLPNVPSNTESEQGYVNDLWQSNHVFFEP